jgi:hypothetical protein
VPRPTAGTRTFVKSSKEHPLAAMMKGKNENYFDDMA